MISLKRVDGETSEIASSKTAIGKKEGSLDDVMDVEQR